MRYVLNAIIEEGFPTRDGALNVYGLVRHGRVPRDLLESARYGQGPSAADIERDDYTRFPWERVRTAQRERLGERRRALLWDLNAGSDGKYMVGFSDGSIEYWDENALRMAQSGR